MLYFPFNDGRGQTARDFSGRKNDGALGFNFNVEVTDPTWIQSGAMGSALAFDGVDDCVTIADTGDLDFADGLTMMAWIKRTGPVDVNQGAAVLSKAFTTQSSAWLISLIDADAKFGAQTIDSNDATHLLKSDANLVAALDTWYHLAGTFERGGKIVLYVNGALVKSTDAGPLPIYVTTVPIRIGCYNFAADGSASRAFFPGIIDEAMVFNRALDAKVIDQYYKAAQ